MIFNAPETVIHKFVLPPPPFPLRTEECERSHFCTRCYHIRSPSALIMRQQSAPCLYGVSFFILLFTASEALYLYQKSSAMWCKDKVDKRIDCKIQVK